MSIAESDTTSQSDKRTIFRGALHKRLEKIVKLQAGVEIGWSRCWEYSNWCRPMCLASAIFPILCLLAAPRLSFAQTWVVQPTVRVEQGFDDNFRLEVDDPDEVFTTRLVGEAKLSRIAENMELAGLVRLDAVSYSGDDSDLRDRNNQLLDGTYDFEGERSTWSVRGTLRRDTLLRTVRIFDDPEDVTLEPDDDVDEGLVRENIRRDRLTIEPVWTYSLTERGGPRIAYRFRGRRYDNEEGTSLSEFDEHTLTGEYGYQFTEKDQLNTGVDLTRVHRADEDRDDDSIVVRTGIEREFSETLRGSADIGYRATTFDVDSPEEDTDDGLVVRIRGSKRTGLTTFAGQLEQNVTPSGSGELVDKIELRFNVSRRLSEVLRFTFRSRLFETETDRVRAEEVTRRFLSLGPRLRWRLGRAFSIDGSYEYRREKIDGDPDSAESNAVVFSLNYTKPTPLE